MDLSVYPTQVELVRLGTADRAGHGARDIWEAVLAGAARGGGDDYFGITHCAKHLGVVECIRQPQLTGYLSVYLVPEHRVEYRWVGLWAAWAAMAELHAVAGLRRFRFDTPPRMVRYVRRFGAHRVQPGLWQVRFSVPRYLQVRAAFERGQLPGGQAGG